jgi:hypothetical protein
MIRKIQIRRGTAADWSSSNPVLDQGEWGHAVDVNVVKVGNGTTPWNSLTGIAIDSVMQKSQYDPDNDGVVEDSKKLDGQTLSGVLSRSNHTGTQAISTVSGLQTALDAKIPASEKGANNGVATLGSDGKVPSSQLPTLRLVEVFTAASEAAMLALSDAQSGDMAIRSDFTPDKVFVLTQLPATDVNNWRDVTVQVSVVSVNGQTGVVVLDTDNINEGSGGNLYFTEARVLASILTGFAVGSNAAINAADTLLQAFGKIQAQLDAKMPIAYLDTSATLGGASASDTKVPSQKAVRQYFLNETATIDGGSPGSVF